MAGHVAPERRIAVRSQRVTTATDRLRHSKAELNVELSAEEIQHRLSSWKPPVAAIH